MATRNITAEQVALANEAADELEAMGNQICDPPHVKHQFFNWAQAVRFVIENFSTAELALEHEESMNEPEQIGNRLPDQATRLFMESHNDEGFDVAAGGPPCEGCESEFLREQIAGYERQLGIEPLSTTKTIGSEIERLLEAYSDKCKSNEAAKQLALKAARERNDLRDLLRQVKNHPLFVNFGSLMEPVAVACMNECELSSHSCPRCSECEGMSHHWIADPRSPDDAEWQPGDYGCKHCDVRGDACENCGEDGCPACDYEAVVALSDEDYDRAMYLRVEKD